jgi:hypothetical protein
MFQGNVAAPTRPSGSAPVVSLASRSGLEDELERDLETARALLAIVVPVKIDCELPGCGP